MLQQLQCRSMRLRTVMMMALSMIPRNASYALMSRVMITVMTMTTVMMDMPMSTHMAWQKKMTRSTHMGTNMIIVMHMGLDMITITIIMRDHRGIQIWHQELCVQAQIAFPSSKVSLHRSCQYCIVSKQYQGPELHGIAAGMRLHVCLLQSCVMCYS